MIEMDKRNATSKGEDTKIFGIHIRIKRADFAELGERRAAVITAVVGKEESRTSKEMVV